MDGRVVQEKSTTLSKGVIRIGHLFSNRPSKIIWSRFFFRCPTPRQLEHAVPVNKRRKKPGTSIGRIPVEIFSKRVRKGFNG